jgi:hypothetical protein
MVIRDVCPRCNTISFELEGMDSVHEISIASQRCHSLGGVTVDEACDVLPEDGKTRSDTGIHDINAAFEVLPQAFDWLFIVHLQNVESRNHFLTDRARLRAL